MILSLIAYLGGVLTIVSPCILPVLPFVFARAENGFLRNGAPLLVGMALTFAVVVSLAAIGGGWAVRANAYGRSIALGVMAVFGITLLFPAIADRMTRPLVALGGRLSVSADNGARAGSSIGPSMLLGVATGLLWTPCAGPILGVILTGAALNGASVGASILLLAYAAGAATSLALALLIGGRVFQIMKRMLGTGAWARRGLGLAVLLGVAAIFLGVDTGLLSKVSLSSTAWIEQVLLDKGPHPEASKTEVAAEGRLDLSGATGWLNSPPLSAEALRGKVVLVDYWTYSCINCLRTLPYVKAWAEKYKNQGLVVIGVHSPEFAFEKNPDNVRKAVADLHIRYPVALDNDYAIWKALNNKFWPAHVFIDAQGRVRGHHFGEGDYEGSEKTIQSLLAEAGRPTVPQGIVKVVADGAEAGVVKGGGISPETYIGFERARGFVSPGGEGRDVAKTYVLPGRPRLNQWGLGGLWTAGEQQASSGSAGAKIVYRFRARDLHLVLGPNSSGKPVRFRVLMDGKVPGAAHGSDTDGQGWGVVKDNRLYQVIRQKGPIEEHTFDIQFLDPGVQAYAFTFG